MSVREIRPAVYNASMRSGIPDSPEVFATLRAMARERPVEVTVRGGCMAPRLADGDRVEVAPARLYWPGDVLVFRSSDGRLRVHRFLGYRLHAGRLACVTRGDGCACRDFPVPLDGVLGRVAGPGAGPVLRLRAALEYLRHALRRLTAH